MPMLPAFASVEDLADRLPGGVATSDVARAQAALDDASALIRAEAGKTWTTAGVLAADLPDIVPMVTIKAAARAFDNPEALVSHSENVGAYGEAKAWERPSNDVYLTSAERRLVKRAAGRTGLAVIATTRGDPPVCGDTQYIDVTPPGEPMPWLSDPVGY